MSDGLDDIMNLLVAGSGEKQDDSFAVRKRGRPKLNDDHMAEKKRRVVQWGDYLRSCRENSPSGFTLSQAAREIGLSSAKLLAAYEGVCFPPGEVLLQLAGIYEVPAETMALQFLRISNPDIFRVLFPDYSNEEGASDEA